MKKDQDKLEEFIRAHRGEFETTFEDRSWATIEKSIKPAQRRRFNWLAAASVVFLLVSSLLVVDRMYLTERVSQLEQLTVEGRSYQEIEAYYSQTIQVKKQLVAEKSDRIAYPLDQDLQDLQQNYQQLKDQLKQGVPHQKVVQAMIWNLRTQIELLNEQLAILDEIKNYTDNSKTHNNEKAI